MTDPDAPRTETPDLRARIEALLGQWFSCTCDEAYTGRGLVAPDCYHHEMPELAAQIAALSATPAPERLGATLAALFAAFPVDNGGHHEMCAEVRYPGSYLEPPDPCTCAGDLVMAVRLAARPTEADR